MFKYSIHQKVCFQILVQGDISETWCEWFANIHFSLEEGRIVLETEPIDQPALLGLLSNLSSLGYFILGVAMHTAGKEDAIKTDVGGAAHRSD